MALGTSSFGTILQTASSENNYTNAVSNVENYSPVIGADSSTVETAGSVAWGGFDVCEFSTTTEVDYSAYATSPVETAGSIASASVGGFSTGSISTGTAVSTSAGAVSSSASTGSSCSYSC